MYAKLILCMGSFHIVQNFLEVIGHLMLSTGIEDIMVKADVRLRGTTNKIISGKDYYAMLHAHAMVYAAMFALHKAFARWLVDEEKKLEDMCVSNNVQQLLNSLSEEDAETATSACADATGQLKKLSCLMAEFNDAHLPQSYG